jgi:hypothetical protein
MPGVAEVGGVVPTGVGVADADGTGRDAVWLEILGEPGAPGLVRAAVEQFAQGASSMAARRPSRVAVASRLSVPNADRMSPSRRTPSD